MKHLLSSHLIFSCAAFASGVLLGLGCGASQSAPTTEPPPGSSAMAAPTGVPSGSDAGSLPLATAALDAPKIPGTPSSLDASPPPHAEALRADGPSPSAGATAQKAVLHGTITTNPPKAAQNAVVYLADAPAERVVNATLLGKDMNFVPHVSVMTAGGTLTFVNGEPFPDTAFSPSNEKWDFGMVPVKASRTRKFEKSGVYTVLCRLHPNELGFLVVTPSSYFARTDKNGSYTIADVPQGRHTIVAWAPKMKTEERTLEIAGDQSVDFELKR